MKKKIKPTLAEWKSLHAQPPRCRQSGITLVEVLVSILLMSFALLGMAALQAQSLAQQTAATTRGNISTLISDLSDRLRSNLSKAPGYDPLSAATFSLTSTWAAQASVPSAPATDCTTTTCDAATRSTYDLVTWQRKVRSVMPQGSAIIKGDVQAGIDVTLMWFDKEFRSVDTLSQSATCPATTLPTTPPTCCPTEAAVPTGVRCQRITLMP